MHDQLDPIDDDDVEAHRLASNDNEVVVRRPMTPADDQDDVEGHKLAANDNETVVVGTPRPVVKPEAD